MVVVGAVLLTHGADVVGLFCRACSSVECQVKSPLGAKPSVEKDKVRAFVFNLTGHVSSRFGVALSVAKTFTDRKSGLLVTTEYCVSFVTRFPFINYFIHLFHVLNDAGGFELDEALQIQASDFPTQAALRFVNDLAQRLLRLRVPIYSHYPKSIAGTSVSGVNSFSQQVNTATADKRRGSGGSHREDLVDGTCPPIAFQMTIRAGGAASTSTPSSASSSNSQRKLEILFRRDVQSKYFIHTNDVVDSSSASARLWRQIIDEDELRTRFDREATFHVLMWSLPILLSKISLDQIVMALGLLLLEYKMIVVCEDETVLSGCLLALINLLRPFK